MIPLLFKPSLFSNAFLQSFSKNSENKQECSQTVSVVFNFWCWAKKKKSWSIFFHFSSCPFGTWVVHLESLNQNETGKKNNMGTKENDIFLGVYFLLPNKVLKSIWVDVWKNCMCFLPPTMNSSLQLAVRVMVVGGISKGDSPCRGWWWASHMCHSNASSQTSLQYVLCHSIH